MTCQPSLDKNMLLVPKILRLNIFLNPWWINVLSSLLQTNHHFLSRSDNDSDNDSAVSSGRSSLSHGSTSPPPLSKLNERKPSSSSSSAIFLQRKSESTSNAILTENPRVLKKDSIEAINRRNIIDSCRSSSGLMLGHTPQTNKTPASLFTRTTSVSSVVKKFPFCDENSFEKEDKVFRARPPPLGRPASRYFNE